MPLTNNSTLSAEKVSKGSSVTVNCSATGGIYPYTYAVYFRRSGAEKWTVAQSTGTNTSVKITPKTAGDYEIKIKVKDAAGSTLSKTLKLCVEKPLTNTSVLSSDNIALGSKVKIRGFAQGGTGDY